MQWSVRWIALPVQLVRDQLHLSLVATPVEPDVADAPSASVADWPALAQSLVPTNLVSRDGSLDLPLTVSSLAIPGGVGSAIDGADVAAAADALDQLERSIARATPTRWPAAHDCRALGAAGELVATRRRGRSPAGPIVRVAASTGTQDPPPRFHLDASVPAYDDGERDVRAAGPADGATRPVWTRIGLDRRTGRCVVAPGGGSAPVDVAVSTLPVMTLSAELDALATRLADADDDSPFTLPAVSDDGVVLARRGGVATAELPDVLLADDVLGAVHVEVGGDDDAFEPVAVGDVVTWEGSPTHPLRYGDLLRFRIRAVDLAGAVADGHPSIVHAVRYLRRTPLAPPEVAGTPAAEPLHLAVRSDAAGRQLGAPVEVVLAPPPVAPDVAARHGTSGDADPMAAGIALVGLPGHAGSVVVPFTGGDRKAPIRLVVQAAGADEVSIDRPISIEHETGSDVVVLHVAPGAEVRFELATPVAGEALRHVHVGDLPPTTLLDGTALLRCARRAVTVVHTVEAS